MFLCSMLLIPEFTFQSFMQVRYRMEAIVTLCALRPTRFWSCSSVLNMGAPGGKALRRSLRCTLVRKDFNHLSREDLLRPKTLRKQRTAAASAGKRFTHIILLSHLIGQKKHTYSLRLANAMQPIIKTEKHVEKWQSRHLTETVISS